MFLSNAFILNTIEILPCASSNGTKLATVAIPLALNSLFRLVIKLITCSRFTSTFSLTTVYVLFVPYKASNSCAVNVIVTD